MQQKAILMAAQAEENEYLPVKQTPIVIPVITEEEKGELVVSLKSQLVKSTSSNFRLIGS